MRRLDVGDHLYRYECVASIDHHPHHPHFLCTDCGEVSCVDVPTATFAPAEVSAMQNFNVTDILFKGICGGCLEK